jgi:protein gp37
VADETGIAWCDHTHNEWIGCEKVSPACKFCYAEDLDARYQYGGEKHWGKDAPRYRTSFSNRRKPYSWDRAAAADGVRRRVFCSSLSDVFEKRPDLDAWRVDLWHTIESTRNLDWLLLTKRPENILDMMPLRYEKPRDYQGPHRGMWLPNVWLGTTVENQEYADLRIPYLLAVPAVVHFLSVEPMLGPINLEPWFRSMRGDPRRGISWVIAGCESGKHARPQNLADIRSLRDQCAAYGIAFLLKQAQVEPRTDGLHTIRSGSNSHPGREDGRGGRVVERPLLDGQEHFEFPRPRPFRRPA